MDKILDNAKASRYYMEALNRPDFINELSEYEIRKILDICEAVIDRQSAYLAIALEWNKDKPNIEKDAIALREGFLGRQLRLRSVIYSALGIKEPIKSEASKDTFEGHFSTEVDYEKLKKILEIGMKLEAMKLTSFLYALKQTGVIKDSFFDLKLELKFNFVKTLFSYSNSKQALGQGLKQCEEEYIIRIDEIGNFKERIISILEG